MKKVTLTVEGFSVLASCNAKPAGGNTPIDNEAQTELVAQNTPKTVPQIQYPQKHEKLVKRDLHVDFSKPGTVQYQKTFKSPNGITYTMYYVDKMKPDKKDNKDYNQNIVRAIVFVPAGYKALSSDGGGGGPMSGFGREVNNPPDLLGIRIHDGRGEGKEWMGVIVSESICNEDDNNDNNDNWGLHREEYEIPVPDDIADELIDIVIGDHPKFVYTYKTRKEFTKSEKLLPSYRIMGKHEIGNNIDSTNKELNYKYFT